MRGFDPRLGLFKIYVYILRGYSLIGKTAILHIVILGSSPDISINGYRLMVDHLSSKQIVPIRFRLAVKS